MHYSSHQQDYELIMIDNADFEYRELSDSQQKLLALLPIPSAILSVIGSIVIITMAFKSARQGPWTPYHGLLTAMSFCNIISAITVANGSFLFPSDTSNKVWALGNEASCTATGFLTQLSSSAIFYNSMLAFYFLALTRFGLSNEEIAKRFEPAMHYVALGYSLLTAFFGLFADAYGERQSFISCWVKTCPFDEFGEREDCKLPVLDVVFGRGPNIFVLCSLVVINLNIWCYSRKRMKIEESRELVRQEKQERAPKSKRNLVEDTASSSSSSALQQEQIILQQLEEEAQKAREEVKATQKRRLRMLSTQSLLFVGSHILCNTPSFVMRFIIGSSLNLGAFRGSSSSSPYVEEMELPYNYFGLMVLQAILYPLQGFVNMLVYVRPAYATVKSDFPEETKFWAFQRAVLGESIAPSVLLPPPPYTEEDASETKNKIDASPQTSSAKTPESVERYEPDDANDNSIVEPMEQDEHSESDCLSILTPSNLNDADDELDDFRSPNASATKRIEMDGSVRAFEEWFHSPRKSPKKVEWY